MRLYIWWRLDHYDCWFPFRVTNSLARWSGSSFSDIDKITEIETDEPSIDTPQQDIQKNTEPSS